MARETRRIEGPAAGWWIGGLAAAVVTLAAGAVGAPGTARAGTTPVVDTADGVVHVRNGSEPVEGDRLVGAEALWSADGDDPDYPPFGAVTAVLFDGDEAYVLDFQLRQVLVFGPDGGLVRTIGRAGEGPGEFGMPMAMSWLPDRRLAVAQVMPNRVVVLARDGTPQDDLPLGLAPGEIVTEAVSADGALVLGVQGTAFRAGRVVAVRRVVVVGVDGTRRAVVHTDSSVIDTAAPVLGDGSVTAALWTADGAGRIYVSAERNAYRIDVYDLDGKRVRVIEREYVTRKRTAEERDEMARMLEPTQANLPNARVEIAETDRDVQGMMCPVDGELWVVSSRSAKADTGGRVGVYEVFDADGRYVRDVTIDVPVSRKTDTVHVVGRRLVVVRGGASAMLSAVSAAGAMLPSSDEDGEDAGPPRIECYRLTDG